MLASLLKAWATARLDPLIHLISKTPLSPNVLTVIGFFLNVGVGIVLAMGQISVGGVLVLFASAFDMVDGALARATKRVSVFGAFLDSTLDRYSEAVLLLGLTVYLSQTGSTIEVFLVFLTLVGSLMVSYTRARAEGLGLKCEVGFLARPERLIILAIGLIIGQIFWVMLLLAFFTNLTAVQRIVHVWRETAKT